MRISTNILKKFVEKRDLLQFIAGIFFMMVIIGCFIYPALFGYFLMLCLVLAMAIGLFLGRYWCNWLCPRGGFLEYFCKFIPPKKKRMFPKLFKNIYFQFFLVLIFMVMMGINLFILYPEVGLVDGLGITLARLLVMSTIVGIILSIFFQPRSWCAICPGGTFAKISAVYNPKTPNLNISTTCIFCKKCEKVCPLQIDSSVYISKGIVNDSDCFKCFTCVQHCPTNSLNFD